MILHLAWLACLFFLMDEQSAGAFSACEQYSTLAFAVPETTALLLIETGFHPAYPFIGAVRFASVWTLHSHPSGHLNMLD